MGDRTGDLKQVEVPAVVLVAACVLCVDAARPHEHSRDCGRVTRQASQHGQHARRPTRAHSRRDRELSVDDSRLRCRCVGGRGAPFARGTRRSPEHGGVAAASRSSSASPSRAVSAARRAPDVSRLVAYLVLSRLHTIYFLPCTRALYSRHTSLPLRHEVVHDDRCAEHEHAHRGGTQHQRPGAGGSRRDQPQGRGLVEGAGGVCGASRGRE